MSSCPRNQDTQRRSAESLERPKDKQWLEHLTLNVPSSFESVEQLDSILSGLAHLVEFHLDCWCANVVESGSPKA